MLQLSGKVFLKVSEPNFEAEKSDFHKIIADKKVCICL